MKKLFLLLAIAIVAMPFEVSAKKLKPKAEYVVFVGIDGWATQVYQGQEDLMPTVKSLMDQGSWTMHKRSTMPSASAINWATIFMGVPTEMHGYNKWNSDKPAVKAYDMHEHGLPPTIYTILREQRPDATSACVYNWDGIAPLIDTMAVDYFQYDPGYHVKGTYTLADYTEKFAVKTIKEMRPNFFTFYIGDVDEFGHTYGWESEEYKQCLRDTDHAIAMIIDALKEAGIYDKTIIIVASDHGGKGKGHGGLTLEEMETPFVICGKGVSNQGEFSDFMMQYDMTAVFAEALGLRCPKEWRARPMPVFKK